MSARGMTLAAAIRSGRLGQLMWRDGFRRTLGAAACADAWRHLGADIHPTAHLGSGVLITHAPHVSVGAGTKLSGHIRLEAWHRITIGANVIMNDRVVVFTGQHDLDSPTFERTQAPVTIGDYVWLPNDIRVMPGVTIGEAAVVGVGSIVTKDVPHHEVWAGNPARLVKRRAQVAFDYVPSTRTDPGPVTLALTDDA